MNGLHGHGPIEDSRHHDGSWKDKFDGGASCEGGAQDSAAHGNAHSHSNGAGGEGGSNNNGQGKITFCHATKSTTNPYVQITTSVNGLHGHGPIDDSRHHEGSWQDKFDQGASCELQQGSALKQSQSNSGSERSSALPEVAALAPTEGGQGVLGEQTAGGNAPGGETPGGSNTAGGSTGENAVLGAQASGGTNAGANGVLGAQASGKRAPAAALAARKAGSRNGTLPFTGLELGIILILGVAALLTGVALRRRAGDSRI